MDQKIKRMSMEGSKEKVLKTRITIRNKIHEV